jgi:hypothetical protein
MSKKSRLSHAQKRKQKLAKRNRRLPELAPAPYTGNRYRSKEFVRPLFETEKGIYDLFVISGREMTDDDVEQEIFELIDQLRTRPVAELISGAVPDDEPLEASIASLILRKWSRLLDVGGLPPRDDLIGILRTILEVWRSKSMSSRGYLNYLEGFMLKAGYQIRVESVDDEIPDEQPDELYEIGQMWLAGSSEARHRFAAFANELLERGQSQTVVDTSQRLLGEIGSPNRPEFPILSELAIRAQQQQRPVAARAPAPGLRNFISRLTGW